MNQITGLNFSLTFYFPNIHHNFQIISFLFHLFAIFVFCLLFYTLPLLDTSNG